MRPPRAWMIMTRISPADATIGFAVVPDARAHDLAHGRRAAPRKSESRKKPYRVLCLVILLLSFFHVYFTVACRLCVVSHHDTHRRDAMSDETRESHVCGRVPADLQ